VNKLTLVIKIWIAYVLDLIFGDPQNIIHPVQIIGKMINIGEKSLLGKKYKSDRKYKFFAGMILNITVISLTYGITYLIRRISENSIIFTVAEIYLMYTIFSINSLAREGNRVYNILKEGNIERARKDLSYLVSRDTETMDEKMIIRSTMETISENTVDGIVAPMLYMFLGGLPLSMTYKAINTFDSMVGYKNEKYMDFGKFSAKLDDVANFIPARITGILIVIASMILGYDYKNSLKIFIRDRKNHSSPNSGHAEAGVAGALGVQFGGRVSYFGKEVDKPVIGDKIKDFELEDIKKNIKIMYVASFLSLVMFSVISLGICFLI
jgi:cobalamin biosynthesis protein cobD